MVSGEAVRDPTSGMKRDAYFFGRSEEIRMAELYTIRSSIRMRPRQAGEHGGGAVRHPRQKEPLHAAPRPPPGGPHGGGGAMVSPKRNALGIAAGAASGTW